MPQEQCPELKKGGAFFLFFFFFAEKSQRTRQAEATLMQRFRFCARLRSFPGNSTALVPLVF
jgi:hypothetical protein